jgi:hypothetical protein
MHQSRTNPLLHNIMRDECIDFWRPHRGNRAVSGIGITSSHFSQDFKKKLETRAFRQKIPQSIFFNCFIFLLKGRSCRREILREL